MLSFVLADAAVEKDQDSGNDDTPLGGLDFDNLDIDKMMEELKKMLPDDMDPEFLREMLKGVKNPVDAEKDMSDGEMGDGGESDDEEDFNDEF